MVTRVDKKPIIYNTTLIRALKPPIVAQKKQQVERLLDIAVGAAIPKVSSRDVLDDYDDIEYAFRVFGIDDPAISMFSCTDDDEDDSSIRIARMCLNKGDSIRKLMRSETLMEELTAIQVDILKEVDKAYFGTEAVYKVFNCAILGDMFANNKMPSYANWATDTTKHILKAQSTYLLMHPTAMHAMTQGMGADVGYQVWNAWDTYKQLETIAIRLSSRKAMLAHAYYYGISKKNFTPDDDAKLDFLLPTTGYCQTRDHVKVYILLGIRYFVMGDCVYVLSHDDCVNLATMAQCYYRVASYFQKSNGYSFTSCDQALTLIKDISTHCCRLIDSKKNFSHIIRSMHIMSQGEFNDAYEDIFGTDLGWKERSANYLVEAKALDPMGPIFHKRAVSLALDDIDKLNVCFIYHAFIGDDMLLDDLRFKVHHMTEKVRGADDKTWADFIKFVKAYTLCRYMMVHKKKPRCGGDISLLNSKWADRCVAGQFTMPNHSDWGRVWIQGEMKYTEFADTWHLEAQDVSYVVRDSKGMADGKYTSNRVIHSELLMAMAHGNILDIKTGSTPATARKRICAGEKVKEVVITTAPKAENAKPSWKKRVTFAADNEFRKMQAEFDRNCRRIMGFVRGPSLGVDQCILEKQFSDICNATSTGTGGAVCSHDISAWSESMDRKRKFEFEQVLINMFDLPDMINIKYDWDRIQGVVNKQGARDVVPITNSSFQGFDGSASTILHSFILIYCMDTARRKNLISVDVKTNMATLIDDCIALMTELTKQEDAVNFWAHLKDTYDKLGFEVDDLKSIFSTIKAIYLSRRFLLGGEVPSDFKVFIKAHSSYEDPLRCSVDIPSDIFGALRGAADANGDCWFIYFHACLSTLCELAHRHPQITSINPAAAAIYALAPAVENGWNLPSIMDWATNDVTDKRAHFNAILEACAYHACQPDSFTRGVDVYPNVVGKAVYSLKSQAWRLASYANIFTNPFEALREGPLKPDMLKRNAVQDMLKDVATAQPWVALLAWSNSSTTNAVREMLIQSGPLHAPTLAALVNCMPDNYRLSMIGKAVGSQSLFSLLDNSMKVVLKRRVQKCANAYFDYTVALYTSTNVCYEKGDFAALTYLERSRLERDEFYNANGVRMTDHTFPDPIATFTVTSTFTGSMISPNMSALRIWDKTLGVARRTNQLISDRGMYIPRRSGRVWEVTSEYAKGWDTVSQRVAMGLAILARAEADGHKVSGLLAYFIKSWNELSNITPEDTQLISIHGSIKRLDSNPGSATHPIITHRNIARGFNNKIKSALDAIPVECKKQSGSASHLHDFLSHETSMTALTVLQFSVFQFVGSLTMTLSYNIGTRPACIVSESPERMTTDLVYDRICIEIMDGADDYGLLQACPDLAVEIGIPTMKGSWVKMINALIDRDLDTISSLRDMFSKQDCESVAQELAKDEVYYSPAVVIADPPASRTVVERSEITRMALVPEEASSRTIGDSYTCSIRTVSSKFTKTLTSHLPRHVMAATAVRSLLWSRLKTDNLSALAKILYQDPEADYSVIKRCATTDFWRGAVAEIDHLKGNMSLSELTTSALRSLGIPGIHILHCNDRGKVCQSVASFFGAHLRYVLLGISDLICSVAGRSSKDFQRPFTERMITNNPSLYNAKIRREHMEALIDYNVKQLNERIELLLNTKEKDKITHRGDKKVQDHRARIAELRCRKYVYLCFEIDETGNGSLNEGKHGDMIENCAKTVKARILEKIKERDDLIDYDFDLPEKSNTFEGTIAYTSKVHDILNEKGMGITHGWHSEHGNLGARLAYDQLMMDVNMVMKTRYAVSAAEVAPKLHRRLITTPYGIPSEEIAESLEVCPAMEGYDSDEFDLFGDEALDFSGKMNRGFSKLPMAYWKVLYALIYHNMYFPLDVNAKLGTGLPENINSAALREAHLEDFSDDDIEKAFPNIAADYVGSGLVFDEAWLERDEAEAYTTDELLSVKGGFLF